MKSSIATFVDTLNPRHFNNNTQKALYKLLTAPSDGWVRLNDFRIPSVGSRIRDLRKDEFGSFKVLCRSASSLGLKGGRHTFYYRIAQRSLTLGRIKRVFEVEV